MNKKILILSFFHPPDLTACSFRVKSIIDEIEKTEKSILIDVVTTFPNRYSSYNAANEDSNSEAYSKSVILKKIKIPKNFNSTLMQAIGFFIYFFGVLKFVKNKDYDLIFATSSKLMTAFLAAIISKQKDTKLFLDIRDLFSDTFQHVYAKSIFNIFYKIIKIIEIFTFRKANVINVVSSGFIDYIKQINPEAKILEYTNGIDKVFLNIDYGKKLTEKNEIKNILYSGNIGMGQGLEHIIPEFSKLVEGRAKIQIIGDGGMRSVLENRVKDMGINNVSFTKPMSRDCLIKELIKADILFMHLNNLECFKKVLPSKIFEYGCTGLPILAGVDGAAKTFINNNIPWAKVFSPGDANKCHQLFDVIDREYKIADTSDFRLKFRRSTITKNLVSKIIKA